MRNLPLLSCCYRPISLLPNRGSAQSREGAEAHVQIAMKNVMYHYTGPIAVHVVQLQGELLPKKSGEIPVFDDKNSFTLALSSAEISISCDALARVLNQNVLSASNSPIKDLTIESKNNQLVIKGKLPQKGDVSFETTGVLTVEGDGRIRLHTEHLKAAHLPVKGLLDLLGVDITGMINTKKIEGISAEKDDLILDPEQILPRLIFKERSLLFACRVMTLCKSLVKRQAELRRKTNRQLSRISPR